MIPTLLIWVQSPLAGVSASTHAGFALGEQLKPRLVAPLENALSSNISAAQQVRREVEQPVFHRLRSAVNRQVAAELTGPGPEFERMNNDIGNYGCVPGAESSVVNGATRFLSRGLCNTSD
jgi:hypothetical protein